MYDDQPDELYTTVRRLFLDCAPVARRPRPRVRFMYDERGKPLIMISQRDDTLLVEPAEAVKLARRLFHVARGARAAHSHVPDR